MINKTFKQEFCWVILLSFEESSPVGDMIEDRVEKEYLWPDFSSHTTNFEENIWSWWHDGISHHRRIILTTVLFNYFQTLEKSFAVYDMIEDRVLEWIFFSSKVLSNYFVYWRLEVGSW